MFGRSRRVGRRSLLGLSTLLFVLGLTGTAWATPAASAPRTLFVSSPSNPGKVSAYSMSLSTGALTFQNAAQGTAVQDIASVLSPNGKFLYSVATGSDVVDVYTVSQTDGSLTHTGQSTAAAGMAAAGAIAIAPDGGHLYIVGVGSGNTGSQVATRVAAYTVSSTDGSLTADGVADSTDTATYANPTNLAVAITPDGGHLYTARAASDQINAFTLDSSTGAASFAAQLTSGTGVDGGPQSLAVNPNDNALYAANSGDNGFNGASIAVYPLTAGAANAATAPTEVSAGTNPNGNNPGAVAVAPNAKTLYVAEFGSQQSEQLVAAIPINANGSLSTASAPATAPDTSALYPQSVTVSPNSGLIYVGNVNGTVAIYTAAANGAPTAAGTGASGTQPFLNSLVINPDQGPTASFPSPTSPQVGTATTFDASTSSDPENGSTLGSYTWDFGDGSAAVTTTTPTTTHTYASTGSKTVTLTVTDTEGCSTQRIYTGQSLSCNGSSAATTTQTFTVNNPPAPTCTGDSPSTAFNTAKTFTPSCSGTGLTYATAVGHAPTKGTVTYDNAAHTATYTPNTNATGTDTFQIQATDVANQTTTDTVTVTIGNPGAPSCTGDTKTTPFNTAADVPLTCTGTGLTYQVKSGAGPTKGTATISGSTLHYVPNASATGTDTFKVTATDTASQSADDTVTVTIGPPPAPSCSGDSTTTPYGTPVNLALTCTGTAVSYAVTPGAGPTRGTATITGSTLHYVPAAGQSGIDTFRVTATDAAGQTASDAVSVVIGAKPAGPGTPNSPGAITPANLAPSVGSGGVLGLRVTAPAGGDLLVLVTATRPHGVSLATLRPGHGRFTYATGHLHVTRGGVVTVPIRLTHAGRVLLARDHRLGRALRVRFYVQFTPTGGHPTVVGRTITVLHSHH